MAGLRAGLALLGELAAPLLLLLAAALAAAKGEDLYAGLTAGAKKGLRLTAELFPALAALFPVLWLFRASGLPELLEGLLHPVFAALCIPEETALLLLLRPFSGSGALSAAAEIIRRTGADSLAGRTAAVMLGSSETTFYVIAVYFSAAGVKDSRWAIPAALCADLACFLSAAWVSRLFWG